MGSPRSREFWNGEAGGPPPGKPERELRSRTGNVTVRHGRREARNSELRSRKVAEEPGAKDAPVEILEGRKLEPRATKLRA